MNSVVFSYILTFFTVIQKAIYIFICSSGNYNKMLHEKQVIINLIIFKLFTVD